MPVAYLKDTSESTPDYFLINMISAEPIDALRIYIEYQGKSKPQLVCSITVTEYSLDNATWYPMTCTVDSNLTDVELFPRWMGYHITWDAMHDISDKIPDPEEGLYNRNMWVRFKASSGNLETILISYRLFYKNPIVPSPMDPSNKYICIDGISLLEQAPEVY
jgi:hypothetical protein